MSRFLRGRVMEEIVHRYEENLGLTMPLFITLCGVDVDAHHFLFRLMRRDGQRVQVKSSILSNCQNATRRIDVNGPANKTRS